MRKLRLPYHIVVVTVAIALTVSAAPALGGTANAAADGPEFSSSLVTEQRGDVARFTVRLQRSDSTTIQVVSRPNNYEATLGLDDANSDGRVTVLFNTYRAGKTRAFTAASSRDDVDVYSQRDVDGPLPVGDYRLRTDDSDSYADMKIEPRSTDAITTMVAPEGAHDRLRTSEAIDRYRKAGNLTARSATGRNAVAVRDTLVLRLEASGLAGPLAEQPGADDSERLRSLLNGDLVSLSVVQTNPTVQVEPARLLLNRSGVHAVAAPARDHYYLVVDTSEARYRRGDDGAVESGLPAGMEFAANVTVEPGSRIAVDEPRSAESTVEVVERSASPRTYTEAGLSFLEPTGSQHVGGRTTVAPGSTVEVTLRQEDDTMASKRVTVGRTGGNGTLDATFDLSDVSEGTTIGIEVVDDHGTLTGGTSSVTVHSPSARLGSPSLTADGGTLYATVPANLTRGGLVTARTPDGSGRLLGVATVDPDDEEASVPLSDLPEKGTPIVLTAVRDLDGDGMMNDSVDTHYEQSDSPRPVQQTVALYRLPPSPTPTPPPTASPAETPTATTPSPDATPSPDGTASPDGTPASGGTASPTAAPPDDGPLPVQTPGFGIPAALVALLVALVPFARRE